MVISMKKVFTALLAVCCCLIGFIGCANLPKGSDIAGKAGKGYTYEGEGAGGKFSIVLYDDGTYSYYEGFYSSYTGRGTWTLDGDILCLTEDERIGTYFVNYFKVEGNDLIFLAENSSNFIYVWVHDGERFIGSPLMSSEQERSAYSSYFEPGRCFTTTDPEPGRYLAIEEKDPTLMIVSETTYSLFISITDSTAPSGSYVIDGEYLKLSTPYETDAFVFKISIDEDDRIFLIYDSELSNSKLLEHLGLGNEIVFR